MKNFKFETIYLLSNREKKARVEKFHQGKNLIIGRNHTGKSTLIKNLFITIGARPVGKFIQWDDDAVTAVEFIANNVKYFAVHQIGIRALFDENRKLIVSTGNYSEWTKAFIQITGFNLILNNKKNESVPADSKCFFLPFYINQDGSWQSVWDTFTGLQGFKSPNEAILDFFSGIKPPLYYEILSNKKIKQYEYENLLKEQKFFEKAKDRLSNSLDLNGPKINEQNFVEEIKELSNAVSELNLKQEKFRDKCIREKEILDNLNQQINLANDALKTFDLDSKFLENNEREKLVCPTCGAEHLDSFLDVLTYSEDARVLRELVVKLNEDKVKVSNEYLKTKNSLNELQNKYTKISNILDTRKGDLLFRDVVESAGSEKAYRAFEDESVSLKKELSEILINLNELDLNLKKLIDKKRSKEILTNFRECYLKYRIKLNLTVLDVKTMKLTSRPNLSGSGGPRSILAYYAALWHTALNSSEPFLMPIVIDSPNQQAQDDVNMPIVLNFISNELPKEMQIIVSSETDTENKFDKKIYFDKPYGLLEEQQYNKVQNLLDPLIKVMLN